jgi:hypothetical protein
MGGFMTIKDKRSGFGLEMKTFIGKDGNTYLVFRTREGAFNAFIEVEAKQAARECGAKTEKNTRQMWEPIWNI